MSGPTIATHDFFATITTASGNLTPSVQPSIGDFLVVIVYSTDSASNDVISDNQGTPNTWTKQTSAANSSDNVCSLWTAPVTQTGSGFEVTYSNFGVVSTPGAISVIRITGQDPTTPVDGTPNNGNIYANAAGTAISNNVGTASLTNDLALLAFAVNTSVSVTWGGALTTLDGSNSLAAPGWVGSATLSSSGATTLTATLNQSTRRSSCGIIIKGPVSNTSVTPGAGSDTLSGIAPTLTPRGNTVIAPFVARRIWQPDRRIILPPWRRAA